MGNTNSMHSLGMRSRLNSTHVSRELMQEIRNELSKLTREFERRAVDGRITKEQFRETLKEHVQCWSAGAQYMFLDRLFNAFMKEFIDGLSKFLKGTSEERVELTFRLYDIDKSNSIEPKELIKIMAQMYSAFYNEDQTEKIKELVHRIFEDLDINGDGSLSLTEFKLMALKEPLIVDFIEQFLVSSE